MTKTIISIISIILLSLISQAFTSPRFLQNPTNNPTLDQSNQTPTLTITEEALIFEEEDIFNSEGELTEWGAQIIEEYNLEDLAITVNTNEGPTVINAEEVKQVASQAINNANGDVNVAASNAATAASAAGVDVNAALVSAIQAMMNAGIDVNNPDIASAIGLSPDQIKEIIRNALTGGQIVTQESVTNSITGGLGSN